LIELDKNGVNTNPLIYCWICSGSEHGNMVKTTGKLHGKGDMKIIDVDYIKNGKTKKREKYISYECKKCNYKSGLRSMDYVNDYKVRYN